MTQRVALVEVGSPRRYLDHLCAHLGAVGRLGGHGHGHRHGASPDDDAAPVVLGIGRIDPDHVVVEFEEGTCELSAAGAVLRLAVRGEGPGPERVAASLAHRLETIGRRENIRVRWEPGKPGETE